MKVKLYTKSYDKNLIKKINPSKIFSAEEHNYASENHYKGKFDSKEDYINHFFLENPKALEQIPFIINFIKHHNLNNIYSLGSGTCVLEFLISNSISSNRNIFASDYDSFLISKAQEFLISKSKNLNIFKFDFFEDDINEIMADMSNPDLVIFFGSAYVMNDEQYIKLLRNLKKSGVKYIIDFYAGFIDKKQFYKNLVKNILNPLINFVYRNNLGKFHGYGRDKKALRDIYKLSNLTLIKELKIANYKYVSILKP